MFLVREDKVCVKTVKKLFICDSVFCDLKTQMSPVNENTNDRPGVSVLIRCIVTYDVRNADSKVCV